MTQRIGRRTLGVSAIALLTARGAHAAALSEIVIDWATYNPVSLVLKDQRLLENAFAPDNITIRWVQSGRHLPGQTDLFDWKQDSLVDISILDPQQELFEEVE